MRKKAFLIIAAMLLCASNIMAQVASGVCGDNITWKLTAESELVIEGTGEMYNYSNNPAAPWSSYKSSIKSVNIKDGVTSIGNWAFAQCSALTDVSISESVTTIGGDAFRECSILEEITLPTGLTQLGTGVFLYCDALKSITVPEGVTIIGSDTFEFCPNLNSITFPSGLTEIGSWALKGAYNLASITCKATTPPSIGSEVFSGVSSSIPVYVPTASIDAYKAADGWSRFTNIQPMIIASGTCGDNLIWKYHDGNELVIEGTGEMYNYSNNSAAPWNSYRGSIKSINIKDGVTSIGNWAFAGCTALTNVSISESVTTIGNNAFRGCSILEGITLPTGLTQLGAEVFYECRNLETATLPEGLSSIETSTFYHCGNLQSVVIPESVTSLGWGVFFGCGKLTSVTCNAITPPSCNSTSFFAFDATKCTLYVPDESVSAYQQANYWMDFIQPLASGTCGENLTWRLTYGDELIVEGTGEMTSAPWLEKYKYNIKKATIKDGVTSIAKEAFHYCTALVSISIPESVISIGNHAFRICVSLTSVVIPQGVTSIGKEVFQICNNLTEVVIPEGVTSIGELAFEQCYNLTEVIIPEGVTSIGAAAFSGCSGLVSINIPESVTTIESSTFSGCSSLTSIVIPEGVTSIGASAFSGCNGLTSIVIPQGVTSIGAAAFYGCSGLVSMMCAATTPPSLGGSVFNSVNMSIPLYVPVESVEVYKAANGWSEFTNILPMGTCGDNLTWKLTPEGELIIEGTGEMYNYYYDIEAPWINYKQSIKKITIEEGVTSIGEFAFEGCDKVVSAVVPASIEHIGWGAFYYCSGELIVNGFPTSGDPMMGGGFSESSFTKVTIADGITEIPDYSFAYCMNLTSIVIPESVTKIGSGAFELCRSLSEITLPSNIQTIGGYAFMECTSLSTLTCKATTAPICNQSSFEGMNSNTAVYVPLEAIASYTNADGWKNLQNIAGVAACGENLTAELALKGYLNIVGTGEMTSIPWEDCKEIIKTITITDGITSIADGAFDNCDNLVEIFSYAVNPPACSDQFEGVDKNTPVYVDEVNAYRAADGWKEFTYITPQNTKILFDSYEKFTQAANENFATITYVREFNNTEWQALYVPFEIPVTEEFLDEFEVADLNDIRQYDRDDDGVADETVVEAFKVTDGVLKANYPYLIRARETGEKNIIVTDATLYATEENSIDCSSVHEKYTFIPTYSTIAASSLTGCYALSSGVWQPVADDASLGAFRFYLSIENRDGNMQAARNIRMRVIGKDTGDGTTNIDNISDAENMNSEMIYDLQGRPVTTPEKGIYIVNGKKVLFK